MTVDTQKLRELHAKSTQGEWRKVGGFPYLYAFAPGQETARSWVVPCVGRFDYGEGNLEFVAAAHNEMPALLAENDALRAELQARQWMPIETAPHDQEVLLGWTEWDGAWRAEVGMASWGWRTDRVSNISRHGRATHWQTLPPAPPQGDGA